MKNWYLILILPLLPVFFSSCEKEITIKPKEGNDLLVVEGHIETSIPPYVILTKSQSFFSTTDLNSINELFVSGADITVSNGSKTVKLREFNSEDLPKVLADTISERLGIKLASREDSDGLRVIVYSTLEMTGQVGDVYTLEIEADGQKLSAVTTIPRPTPLDSLWSVPHPTNDTLSTVYVRFTDPAGDKNFVRYFTSVDRKFPQPPFFTSVLADQNLINVDGKTFDFPIEQGHGRYEVLDFSTFTYFTKGDTLLLRWCAIDEAHFNFWSSAEFDRNSVGNPFASPTIIKSNINGGLGIWGGYSPTYHSLIIK